MIQVRIRSLCCSACLAVILQISAPSPAQQGSANPPSADIYRNFIGRWDGTSEYHADGRSGRDHVTMVITEELKKHRMRWRSSIGSFNEVRFVELDPAKATMKMDREVGPEWYEVQGLREFADSGIGDFVATSKRLPFVRYSFHLDGTRFIYTYAESRDGKNFETLSRCTFTRQH